MDMNTILNLPKALTVVACLLALAPAGLRAATPAKPVEKQAIIKSVDANKHQIVVTDPATKTTGTFLWNNQTKFLDQGKPMKVEVLKENMTVDLAYLPAPGNPVLQLVKLVPPKAPAKPLTKEPAKEPAKTPEKVATPKPEPPKQ